MVTKETAAKFLDSCSKVVFIRDPLFRVVSTWRDKFGPIEFTTLDVKEKFYVSSFYIRIARNIYFIFFYRKVLGN